MIMDVYVHVLGTGGSSDESLTYSVPKASVIPQVTATSRIIHPDEDNSLVSKTPNVQAEILILL